MASAFGKEPLSAEHWHHCADLAEELLSSSKILLFMKGSPDSPRCRFSRAAVQILREHRVDFDHVDVLEQPSLRLALQDTAVLLGGSDQLRELAQQGDLLDALRSSTARERAALALTLQRPSPESGICRNPNEQGLQPEPRDLPAEDPTGPGPGAVGYIASSLIRRRVSSEDGVTGTCSLLRVVDLAGSDRTKKSKVEGLRLKETNAINRSLLALGRLVQQHVLHCYWRRSHPSASELGRILLSRCPSRGNVVNALAFRKQHVPIRDSKLTLMLSDSLGGNCKTAMLVCVGPCASHAAETLSSLEFASRAMHIEARKSTHASTFCPVRPPSLGSRDMYKASPNRPKASASLQLGGPRGPRRRRLGFFGVIRPVVEGF
eukprot:s5003_g2.t2